MPLWLVRVTYRDHKSMYLVRETPRKHAQEKAERYWRDEHPGIAACNDAEDECDRAIFDVSEVWFDDDVASADF